MTAVTHNPRISLFTLRCLVSKGLEMVCETGANNMLIDEATAFGHRVTSVVGGDGGIPSGIKGYEEVIATCENYYLTVTSMIAPSPDWVVQINNMPLLKNSAFIKEKWGRLFAYDRGTDSGREFTDPSNPDLEIPTVRVVNIVPLAQDETDRFNGYSVGWYKVVRLYEQII